MKKALLTLLLAMIAATVITARDVRSCKVKSTGQLVLLADSIDFRPELTRLYGRLSGVPHTSGRIDVILISGSSLKEHLTATDIDGVDFKRWFQWEDDGIIPVEIDFPKMKPSDVYLIQVEGPKGESQWKLQVGQRRK